MKLKWSVVMFAILGVLGPSFTAHAELTCNPNQGVWVCNRATDFGVGNHSYLWDARTGQACGTSSSFGWGDVNRSETGPNRDSCNFVPLSEGREHEILNECRNNANNGIWLPGMNDCHNAAEESVTRSGLRYPGAPGRRLGDRNSSRSDSPAFRSQTNSRRLYSPAPYYSR